MVYTSRNVDVGMLVYHALIYQRIYLHVTLKLLLPFIKTSLRSTQFT